MNHNKMYIILSIIMFLFFTGYKLSVYNKLKSLYLCVHMLEKQKNIGGNKLKIIFISIYQTWLTFIKYGYDLFLKYLYSPKLIGTRLIAVPYHLNNKLFYVLVKKDMKKASNIVKILSNDKDVTEDIMGYMGPNQDFYKQIVTPSMFGYENLNIYFMENGMVKTISFNKEDVIKL